MEIRFILYVFLYTIILISCKEDVSEDKSVFGLSSNPSRPLITIDKYTSNSINLIDYYRKDLQYILNTSIKDILDTYKITLEEIEKNKIYSTSEKEYQQYLQTTRIKALDSLVSKDLHVNYEYSKLLNDLERMNLEYSNKYKIPIDSFKSYYTLDKIILSDEVLLKVQELIKDNQKHALQKEKELQTDMFFSALHFVPLGTASVSKIAINQIHLGIKLALHNKPLQENSGKITKIVFDYAKKSGTYKINNMINKKIIEKTSNEAKRIVLSTKIESGLKRKVVQESTNIIKMSDTLSHNKKSQLNTFEDFKVIENKIEGRIGDFSDGILAVHLQNIRETIKYNQNLIRKEESMIR
ncbi:hypothetical protein JSO54_08015 [Riemerella anatipestifer]|uniref:hypothetical protein n=1 Tax=Riemerella anatipestifer TaxID=34085 RepID=UPI0030C234CA